MLAYLLFSTLFFGGLSLLFSIGRATLVRDLVLIIGFSFLMAAMHFWFSAYSAVRYLMDHLGAVPPDPKDGIHKRLINVMDEIHVATGNKRNMKCRVIPSLSMNALAAADLKGEAVIAITEGLLSRLTRPQLEAVMAHEAYHIISGDCMETTVAASLFGMYASLLEKLEAFSEKGYRGVRPGFPFLRFLLLLNALLSMLISREREYRADAASLRMTRNPVALAEVLQLLSRNWTGTGLISSGIEMLCITHPGQKDVDESEGWWADLMSTHPPIEKRIGVLLKMSHIYVSGINAAEDGEKVAISAPGSPDAVYYALDHRQQWQGPFSAREIGSLSWLTPLTWISSGLGHAAERASEINTMQEIFRSRLMETAGVSDSFVCPSCRQPLREVVYEKTQVHECNFCGGVLVENEKIPRIIARREKECTERVKSLATAVIMDNQRALSAKKLRTSMAGEGTRPLLKCAKCGNPMFRLFYSMAYLVEIDRCNVCRVTWFDADELEMLQCLVENKITGRLVMPFDEGI